MYPEILQELISLYYFLELFHETLIQPKLWLDGRVYVSLNSLEIKEQYWPLYKMADTFLWYCKLHYIHLTFNFATWSFNR